MIKYGNLVPDEKLFCQKDISLLMTETIVLKVYKKFNVWIKYIYCRFITEFKGKENKWKILERE